MVALSKSPSVLERCLIEVFRKITRIDKRGCR